jgi:hypothetical protein
VRRVTWLLVVTICLVAPACSDDDDAAESALRSTTTSEPVVSRVGPVAIGTFVLTGAVEATGPFEIIYSRDEAQNATCQSIAAAEATSFIVPVPTANGDLRLSWRAAVDDWTGPGTYDLAKLETVAADARSTPDAERVRYSSGAGTTATLEVTADNSGSFTFAGLRDRDGAELSGRVDWTCTIR